MNVNLRNALIECETDVDEAISRLAGDESLYVRCLAAFVEDQTMIELEESLRNESWDDVFTAAHALKGVAGNMGFIPLFQASAEMVVLIRSGRTDELQLAYQKIKQSYDRIFEAICDNIDGN